MPREEMHVCKPRCVNSRSEAASHVLCGDSVSSQWNVGCTHQTLGVGGGGGGISFSWSTLFIRLCVVKDITV